MLARAEAAHGQEQIVQFIAYDNHANGSAHEHMRGLRHAPPTLRLMQSVGAMNMSLGLGYHLPAAERDMKGGDRERWLMRTLPGLAADVVIHLDGSDSLCLCSAAEIVAKIARLTSRPDDLVMGGEVVIWPRDVAWNGTRVLGTGGHLYPPRQPPPGRKTKPGPPTGPRYINIGALAGSPRAFSRLLDCMRERYADFPLQCPKDFRNGDYIYEPASSKKSRTWYDQGCYHMYFIEQYLGRLPPSCPRIVMDHNGHVFFHAPKLSQYVEWGSPRPRVEWLKSSPCIIHTPGSSKYLLPNMQLWWDIRQGDTFGEPAIHFAETSSYAESAAAFQRYLPNPIGNKHVDLPMAWAYFNATMLPMLKRLRQRLDDGPAARPPRLRRTPLN